MSRSKLKGSDIPILFALFLLLIGSIFIIVVFMGYKEIDVEVVSVNKPAIIKSGTSVNISQKFEVGYKIGGKQYETSCNYSESHSVISGVDFREYEDKLHVGDTLHGFVPTVSEFCSVGFITSKEELYATLTMAVLLVIGVIALCVIKIRFIIVRS